VGGGLQLGGAVAFERGAKPAQDLRRLLDQDRRQLDDQRLVSAQARQRLMDVDPCLLRPILEFCGPACPRFPRRSGTSTTL